LIYPLKGHGLDEYSEEPIADLRAWLVGVA
jgi:hypothetical protein